MRVRVRKIGLHRPVPVPGGSLDGTYYYLPRNTGEIKGLPAANHTSLHLFKLAPGSQPSKPDLTASSRGTAQGSAWLPTSVAFGASLTAVHVAGRWKSARMPARYARGELAGNGAVACYYGGGK